MESIPEKLLKTLSEILIFPRFTWHVPGGSVGKESTFNARDTDVSLGLEDPLEEEMTTHFSILAWKLRGNSLAGYSPWGCKESDTTEKVGKQATWHVNN